MRQITDRDRLILPDLAVGIILGLLQLSRCQFFIQVNSHQPFAHMKTNIISSEQLPDRMRKNMLAGMLLHMVQPGLPVQHRFDLCPNRQRPLTIMHYFAAALRSISHLHAAQRSAVTQLTAALRKKYRPVQNHGIPAFIFCTAQHRCQATFQHRILFI